MNRRGFKILALATVVSGGLSACNGLNGIQVNSNVLQGLSGGFHSQQNGQSGGQTGAETRAPEAAPEVNSEPLSALSEADPQTVAAQEITPVTPPPETKLRKRAEPSIAPSNTSAPSYGQSSKTVAGLGDPGRAGLWMETPLVSSPRNARVTAPNGRSVVVTLEPVRGDTGAGSRLSIGAMRSLGLPLTELVELRVGPV